MKGDLMFHFSIWGLLNSIRGGQFLKRHGKTVFTIALAVTILLIDISITGVLIASLCILASRIGLRDYIVMITKNIKNDQDFRNHVPYLVDMLEKVNIEWAWRGVIALGFRGFLMVLPLAIYNPLVLLCGLWDGLIFKGLHTYAVKNNLPSKVDWAWSRFEFVSGGIKYGLGFYLIL